MTLTAPTTGIVTVTYGRRWSLLRQRLAAAQDEGATHAWVVDNGPQDDITMLARDEFGAFVTVVSLPRNCGSAGGFKAGLAAASTGSCDFILILDDDNCPEQGALEKLVAAHDVHVRVGVPADRLAVLAFRSVRQADVAAGIPASGMQAKPSAFFGFRLADLPFKVFRRTPMGRRWIRRLPRPPFVSVEFAPYSGLLFHRSMLPTIGLPDENLGLYADDTESTYRIILNGGKIFLHSEGKIKDLEQYWAIGRGFKSIFDAILLGDSDFRSYYTMRNCSYFESHFPGKGNPFRIIKKLAFLAGCGKTLPLSVRM